MSRLAWRLLAEGVLEIESSLLLGNAKAGKYPSYKICCYTKLMQADHGRGGILYIYPNKSSLGHYIVFSFLNITVRETWVTSSACDVELILDFEPVVFSAPDTDAKNMWIIAFRSLEKIQLDHSARSASKENGHSPISRVPHEELEAADIAVHLGEHLYFRSPHKDKDLPIMRDVDRSELDDDRGEMLSRKEVVTGHVNDIILLNNRDKWDPSIQHPTSRPAVVVIEDLIHTIQALYGVTKEGQRMDSDDKDGVDEWHVIADSQMFDHFAASTSELQIVCISSLEDHEKSKFFISLYSLLSMHAAGVLKITLKEVLDEYCSKIAYLVAGEVYTLSRVMELCNS